MVVGGLVEDKIVCPVCKKELRHVKGTPIPLCYHGEEKTAGVMIEAGLLTIEKCIEQGKCCRMEVVI